MYVACMFNVLREQVCACMRAACIFCVLGEEQGVWECAEYMFCVLGEQVCMTACSVLVLWLGEQEGVQHVLHDWKEQATHEALLPPVCVLAGSGRSNAP